MENEYTPLVAGMTGAQVIETINGNSNISKQQFESILASIALLVLGNNVQQIRVEGGSFQYTVDGTNWSGVDNNVWGSIVGDINAQTDLKNALDAKAGTSDVQGLATQIASLATSIQGLTSTVNANTQGISQNTTAIGAIQTKQAKQVSSDTILGLRIGSSGFLQYSLNGTTWLNVQSLADVNWGSIGGEISNQQDLMELLSSKANNSALTAHINNTSNPHQVTKAQVGLGNVDNTSDANKPISTAQQAKFDEVDQDLLNLLNNKIQVTEDIQSFEYVTLAQYNYLKEEGALSDTTIYFVN